MAGMDAIVDGDNQVSIGGDGGEAPQWDGRGGRGGRLGGGRRYIPEWALLVMPDGAGEGGHGAHSARWRARFLEIEALSVDYDGEIKLSKAWPQVRAAPIDWLNARLEAQHRPWRVRITAGAWEFIDVRS